MYEAGVFAVDESFNVGDRFIHWKGRIGTALGLFRTEGAPAPVASA
jgi:hypothetical protein